VKHGGENGREEKKNNSEARKNIRGEKANLSAMARLA
jgi:hypothetical protein